MPLPLDYTRKAARHDPALARIPLDAGHPAEPLSQCTA